MSKYGVIFLAAAASVMAASGDDAFAQARTAPAATWAPAQPHAVKPAGSVAAAAPSAGKQAEQPPVSSDPEVTTASFGDWVLRCRKINGTATCETTQSVQIQGQGVIAAIAFGKLPGGERKMSVVIVLPNNVAFAAPASLSIDDKDKPFELVYRRCLPSGCFAENEVKDDVIAHWRGQNAQGRLAFRDGRERNIVLPFSFRGLAQALDAMAKS